MLQINRSYSRLMDDGPSVPFSTVLVRKWDRHSACKKKLAPKGGVATGK